MTGFKIFLWFVLTAVLYAAWSAALWPLRKKNKILLGAALAVVEFLLAAVAAYVDIASARLLPRGWQCLLAMFYTVWLADAATGVCLLVVRCFKKSGFRGAARFAAGLCVTLLFLGYMVVNSQIVTADHHTYTSKKLTREHTFVFLSDLHYGHTQTANTVDKTLAKIRAENPEFILLGGDITDEFTSKEDMRRLYERIGALGVPVYFVYGNHDRQDHAADVGGRTYSDEDLTAALTAAGIRVLCDDCAELDDLLLLGRENDNAEGRAAVGELPARPADKYVVAVDHSPYFYDDIAQTDADLQVSGHVHAGQLFPLRLIYPLFVDNVCGEYRVGDTVVYVSPGASGWCFPLRSQAHCHFEVFHLTTP